MKKINKFHFDGAGNRTAVLEYSVDGDFGESRFAAEYESTLFSYFERAFSSIADNLTAKKTTKEKMRRRPLVLSVSLSANLIKKGRITETVSCDKGAKNLYKSRIIHRFEMMDGEWLYLGTTKKANAEKASDISLQNT